MPQSLSEQKDLLGFTNQGMRMIPGDPCRCHLMGRFLPEVCINRMHYGCQEDAHLIRLSFLDISQSGREVRSTNSLESPLSLGGDHAYAAACGHS